MRPPLLLGAALLIAMAAAARPAAAQPNPGWIRVAIARNDPQVTLQILGRYTLFALHTGHAIHQAPRLLSVPVRGVPQGLALGEQIVPFLGVRIEPARDAAINVNGRRLRGTIEIVRQKDMTLLVVNHIALEDYLRGVLSKEAPDYWPEEALNAIAIAARTYAVYQRFSKEAKDYDVTADVMSQDYGGKTAEKVATSRAVKATTDWIVMYRGALFPTFYHSTCGGVTENGRVMGSSYALPPLVGGIVCRLCTSSPFYSWQRRLTRADVAWALRKSRHGSIGTVRSMEVTRRTAAGRAQTVTIRGALRTLALSGYDVRALFGFERIRSPLFTVVDAGDAFVIDGHGWGHGVGLCQWGAAELARRGFSAREILSYYYPGTELVNVQALSQQPIVLLGGS